jgi:hypothetical protein
MSTPDPCFRISLQCPLCTTLLLLILNQLYVVTGNILISRQNPILHLLAQIPLYHNLLPPRRRLDHASPRRELLPQVLTHLLILQAPRLKPTKDSDVLPLVALHALDEDFGGGFALVFASLSGESFGLFFGGVLFGALAGVYGEGGEVGVEGVWMGGRWVSEVRRGDGNGEATFRVYPSMHVRVILLEPVLAFFDGAAELAVLLSWRGCQSCLSCGVKDSRLRGES